MKFPVAKIRQAKTIKATLTYQFFELGGKLWRVESSLLAQDEAECQRACFLNGQYRTVPCSVEFYQANRGKAVLTAIIAFGVINVHVDTWIRWLLDAFRWPGSSYTYESHGLCYTIMHLSDTHYRLEINESPEDLG